MQTSQQMGVTSEAPRQQGQESADSTPRQRTGEAGMTQRQAEAQKPAQPGQPITDWASI